MLARLPRSSLPLPKPVASSRCWTSCTPRHLSSASATTAAIVALDLPVVNRDVVHAIRQLVGQRTAIPPENVMISAYAYSHRLNTRLGGNSLVPRPVSTEEGSRSRRGRTLQRIPHRGRSRFRALAMEDLQPAHISAGIGHEDSLPFNRRFQMKQGTVVFNPGIGNPKIVRPVGPIDPSVPVVLFEGINSKPLATMVNYTMHLDTVGGDVYSADYPYTLARCLADVQGPEMLTLFTMARRETSITLMSTVRSGRKARVKRHASGLCWLPRYCERIES